MTRTGETIRRERDQLRQELADLHASIGWIDPAYSAALRDAADLALTGIRRPDDLGGQITTNGSSTRPPSYVPKAYDILRKQRKWQRDEAAKIRRKIRLIVDQDGDAEDTSEAPRSAVWMGRSVPTLETHNPV